MSVGALLGGRGVFGAGRVFGAVTFVGSGRCIGLGSGFGSGTGAGFLSGFRSGFGLCSGLGCGCGSGSGADVTAGGSSTNGFGSDAGGGEWSGSCTGGRAAGFGAAGGSNAAKATGTTTSLLSSGWGVGLSQRYSPSPTRAACRRAEMTNPVRDGLMPEVWSETRKSCGWSNDRARGFSARQSRRQTGRTPSFYRHGTRWPGLFSACPAVR